MSDKSIEQGKKNLERHRQKTQFTAGSSAVENGRKGAYAKAANKRKKDSFRNNLKFLLSIVPEKTPTVKKALSSIGLDPEDDWNWEMIMTIGVLQQAVVKKDLRAVEMIMEYMGEDPHTQLEEKRIKAQTKAIASIRNSDGFMEAMGETVREVFEDGGDTPDALEDSE